MAHTRPVAVILADEMGLGKTVQAVSFLRAVSEEAPGRPHLVVAPLSTLSHWERELAAWAPDLNVVTLHGNPKARDAIVLREFFGEGTATAGRKGRAGSDKVRGEQAVRETGCVKKRWTLTKHRGMASDARRSALMCC